MKSKGIEEQVLSRIVPGRKEEEKVRLLVTDLLRVATTVSGCDCVVVGSIGKQTWLAGDHDIDLFVMFPAATPRDQLETQGLDVGKRIAAAMKGTWRVQYAEHPYTHAMIKGYDIDIVPCYRIMKGDRIISAVDRSPLHMEYVLENLTPAMQNEVRLLKQFCKGTGVYGSDAKRLGFSGYIGELLVMRYGSFAGVLQASAQWEIPQVVDVEVQREGTHHFYDQPLAVVDPTDPGRNAAANLSSKNMVIFMQQAKSYLAKPAPEFFFPKPAPPLSAKESAALRQRGSLFLALVFPKPDVIDDVLYPQVRKATGRIESYLKYHEFLTVRSHEYVGKNTVIILELETWSLPAIKKMVGPPIFSHKHSREFLAKYGSLVPPKGFGPSLEDNRWVADKVRDYTSAENLLRDLLKKNADELQAMGVPKYIAQAFRAAKLLAGAAVFALLKRDKALSAAVRKEYFEKMWL